LQQRLVKTGGRLAKHARHYWLLLAEGHLNRRRCDKKRFPARCHQQAREAYNGAVFEFKKEIPV
jgi:hypothetical protein